MEIRIMHPHNNLSGCYICENKYSTVLGKYYQNRLRVMKG